MHEGTMIDGSFVNESAVSKWAYTWDGEKNLVLSKTMDLRRRVVFINKKRESFRFPYNY